MVSIRTNETPRLQRLESRNSGLSVCKPQALSAPVRRTCAQCPHIWRHQDVTRTTRTCYVLRSQNHLPSRKLASKKLYAHNSSCKQVFTLRGFLIQGEIKREVLRTATQPSTNWDWIAILKIFFLHPAVVPLRISYARGLSSIMPCAPYNVFPFAEASEAPAPPPASLRLVLLQSLCEGALGPRAVPPTASAASTSALSGVFVRLVRATFGINSGESLSAKEFSMYFSPSRVPRG